MSTGQRIRTKATRASRKLRKHAAVRRLPRHDGDPLIVFVVGCQRSGTTMLGEVLDRSMDTWVYHEHDRRAFDHFRLRTAEVERLARWSGRPVAVFKPIVDAHWTDRFLDRHPGSRAIWIHRRHADVVRSAVAKWGEHQRWIVDGVRRRAFAELGWRGERLPDHVIETVDRVHRPDLTAEEGAAIFWWMRNSILWDRDLVDDDRVLVVRYQDLVTGPEPAFRRVFDFIGLDFDPRQVAAVSPASVRDAPLSDLSDPVRALCDEMEDRLAEVTDRSPDRRARPQTVSA